MKELYKILLVDDEVEVRKSIIKKINWEEEGFLVVGDAENGVEALEKIENLNPDLVFTDIRMPYMDGLELINEINIRYPLIKSIIFSGFDDFDYAKEAIKMGVIEYVLKPVSAVELTEKNEVWELEAAYLAKVLSTYVMCYSPQRIILGGGVMEQKQLFPLIQQKLVAYLNGYINTPEIEDIQNYVVPGGCEGNQGILGALVLGQRALDA